MKRKVFVVVLLVFALALISFASAPSALAGDPNSCAGLPNPEITMSCFEQLHSEAAITANPQGWLDREPFLTPLANQLKAAGWNASPVRISNVFASWKYERGYWRTVMYGNESQNMVNLRNWLTYANDEEAFRALFDIGQRVFAVNDWPPTSRYTRQFGGAW